ncbi:aspartyl-tRNA amidotransferase subunit B [Petrotoga sp. 9T1HF07.CasAA.8.2]|uniref:GatB/YqeY domain-containing protein n=1 Tax=Petrotoga sp. 9T1HF07.CasAA.8.2 TaxID=1434329 RepID=UPI000CBBE7BC|nr:GatB/YqeY domain-containing protein [Petrotoga sp. 9T1HF07.CasAA.8.2]PNR88272.1 aspartyl-tRNA amidotransferase subunit B [Petrotoga sp. 9T1HF07.CasAA.8.2]
MLKDILNNDLKKYMKEKNTLALNAVRSIISEIKNKEVEKGAGLTEEEIIQVIKKQIKMREDSIEQFEKADRIDLAEKERKEVEILQSYLPEQLSDEELKKIIEETISEVNATSKKDFGKVMKLIIQKVQGRADGKKISEILSTLLN